MTRIFRSVGFVLALATVGLGGGALAWTASGNAAAQSNGFTPLPPGWELCVLEGLNAPATAANVVDLDEWQAAEGGSTNNTAAYNPFNTERTTDATNAPIPGADSANGFPAFPSWAAGCSATVATLFQPNMWVITAALRAGNVTPQAAFLAVVDQSQWCAPSRTGVPCYVNAMEVSPGSLVLAVPASSALDVYGNVNKDLQTYQQSLATVAADQNEMGIRDFALAVADSHVTTAQGHLGAASRSLQSFAVNEYISSGLYSGAPLVSNAGTQPLSPSTPQDTDGVVVQQYLGVTANSLVSHDDTAVGAYKAAEQRRGAASKALARAAVALTSDESAESKDLTQLITDVAILEHAGACPTVTITPPPSNGSAVGASTTTTTTTTIPTTTTTTLPPTTTTTVPPTTTTTTTTTTVSTTVPLGALTPTTTTTTTTVPPTTTTTTTTTEPSTTTTTTVPPAAAPSTVAAPPAEAAGVVALQGCIASFAPPSSSST
jgi:hypothetical protein